jgi:hypothetical protein
MDLRKLENIKPHIEFLKVDNVGKLMNERKLGKMECQKIDKLDNQ